MTTLCITTKTAPVCSHWTAQYMNIDTDISLETIQSWQEII